MKKLNNEELWDECVSVFNTALAKANEMQDLRWWKRSNQAKAQIREMLKNEKIKQISSILCRSIQRGRGAFEDLATALERVILANRTMANALKKGKEKTSLR